MPTVASGATLVAGHRAKAGAKVSTMKRSVGIVGLALMLGQALSATEGAAKLQSRAPVAVPEITSPKHRESVPRNGIDPPCRQGLGCAVVNVEGRIPPGLTPFLAVAPLTATPRIWLQPRVAAIRKDRSFDAIVYLGSDKIGIGERFTIYVFGCKNETRFQPEDVIENLPKDCVISEPVSVTRMK
jgi:hypothetical protein